MTQDSSAAARGDDAQEADRARGRDARELDRARGDDAREADRAREPGDAQQGEDAAGVTASGHAAPRGPGRPPAGGEDKHERILTEAFDLFAEHGYAGTSLSAVADAAKISKAGLLHHFGSKTALFSAVLARRDELDSLTATAGPDPWDLMAALAAVAERNARTPAAMGLYLAMVADGIQSDNPAHRWLHGHLDNAVGVLARGLEAGKEAGTVHQDAPSTDIARTFVATADGLQIQWMCARADWPEQAHSGHGPGLDMTSQLQLLIDLFRQQWSIPAAQ
ncbi:MAG TPA: helix-turn-helix domain-containing protein [Ruania sp.]|nr:helix-turn-helix domain-containing protein [Ruania sp.]